MSNYGSRRKFPKAAIEAQLSIKIKRRSHLRLLAFATRILGVLNVGRICQITSHLSYVSCSFKNEYIF